MVSQRSHISSLWASSYKSHEGLNYLNEEFSETFLLWVITVLAEMQIKARGSSDVPPGGSQVGVVGSAADGGVDGADRGALGAGEGHIVIQGVFGVGHAAADAAPGPV